MNNYNKRKMEKDASLLLTLGGAALAVLLARRAVKNFVRDLPNRKLDEDIIVNDKLPEDIVSSNISEPKQASFSKYYFRYSRPMHKQANFNSYYDRYSDYLYKQAAGMGLGHAIYGLGKGYSKVMGPLDNFIHRWIPNGVVPTYVGKGVKAIGSGLHAATIGLPQTYRDIRYGYGRAQARDAFDAAIKNFKNIQSRYARGLASPDEFNAAKAQFDTAKAQFRQARTTLSAQRTPVQQPFNLKTFFFGDGTYANGQPMQGAQMMPGQNIQPWQYYQQLYGFNPAA